MKKIVLILASVAITLTSSAQKVALHTSSGVQHFEGTTGLQSAYTASSAGDTIYLSGGGSYAAPAEFAKSLTIYGAGHYPDSTTATGTTTITGYIILRETADNFHIEGIHFPHGFRLNNNEAVDNVTVKYCRMGGVTEIWGNRTNLSKNTLFINTVFDNGISLDNAQNPVIQNSIIAGQISNAHGGLFSNNVIMHNQYYSSASLFNNGSNNYIQSNIIYFTRANSGSINNLAHNGNGNVFKNNIMNSDNPNFGNFSEASEDNSLGIIAADILVNQSGIAFDYTHDYHLQDPATYLGTDGTQVGIYGGAFPYKEGAVPSNPHIQVQNIAPTATNGQLNVQIKAAAQDN